MTRLLTVTDAAEEGYQKGYKQVEDKEIASWLKDCARQRYAFKNEIKNEIGILNGSNTVLSAADEDPPAPWVLFSRVIGKENLDMILRELIRCEEHLLRIYLNALNCKGMPVTTRSVLSPQLKQLMLLISRAVTLKSGSKG